MVVNCFYDECTDYADIINIPELDYNINEIQNQFFRWMFDKQNDHKYWLIADGEKVACRYGTCAFVEWVNENLLSKSAEKAYMIEENATEWNDENISLFF